MKTRFLLILSVLLLFSACGKNVRKEQETALRHQQELDYIFDLNALPDITIEISTEEWNKLLKYIDDNPRMEEMVKADFQFSKNGQSEHLTNVGFRIRGNVFSRERPERNSKLHNPTNAEWSCAHFRINFNENVGGQRLMGLRSLNLKYFNNDPLYAREIYSYDLFRRYGVYTAPRNSYCRLYIKIKEDSKPAYFGVYGMVEPIDSVFIQARFPGNSDGDLWKCLWGSDFKTANMSSKIGMENINPTNDKLSKRPPYDLKTNRRDFDNAARRLKEYIEGLNRTPQDRFPAWAKKHMDVDLMLRAQAVNILVGMWDDYWINQNNYYVYIDRKGKLYFIPYDYDNTLGTTTLIENSGTRDPFKWSQDPKNRPLVEKVLKVPEYKSMYSNHLAILTEPTNKLFDLDASVERIRQWEAMVEPYITNDAKQFDKIMDLPARWSLTQFYRVFSGDHYGGPLEANYFSTRIYTVRKALKLLNEPKPPKIKIKPQNIGHHPNGYYTLFYSKPSFQLSLSSPDPIARLEILGALTNRWDNPPETVSVSFPKRKRAGLSENPQNLVANIVACAYDKEGRMKREIFRFLFFDNSYRSPEFVGTNEVIFRLPYSGTNQAELRGPFNQWGHEQNKKIFLHRANKDFWELRTNRNAVSEGMYIFYVKDESFGDHGWEIDFANTNNIGSQFFAPLYIIPK